MFKPLLRTIPTLTGNFTLACKIESYKKNSIRRFATSIQHAVLMPLQNHLVNRLYNVSLVWDSYEFNIKDFYKGYSSSFYSENYEYDKINSEIIDLASNKIYGNRNSDYEFGCKRNVMNTGYQFMFYAPFYISRVEDIPDKFVIELRFNDRVYKTIDVYIGDTTFTRLPNNLNTYLRRYVNQIDDRVIFCLPETNQAAYFGIDAKYGGFKFVKDNVIGAIFNKQLNSNEYDKMINGGFSRNKLVMRQIIPLSFLFNIEDILTAPEYMRYIHKRIEIRGWYEKNGMKYDFYDFDTNYDDLKINGYDGNILAPTDNDIAYNINLNNSLREKFDIDFKYDNTVSKGYNRWCLLPTVNFDEKYITNSSDVFLDRNNNYYNYPVDYNYNMSYLYYDTDNHDIDKDKSFNTLTTNYLDDIVTRTRLSKTMIDNEDKWYNVYDNKVMIGGVLYDLNNVTYTVHTGNYSEEMSYYRAAKFNIDITYTYTDENNNSYTYLTEQYLNTAYSYTTDEYLRIDKFNVFAYINLLNADDYKISEFSIDTTDPYMLNSSSPRDYAYSMFKQDISITGYNNYYAKHHKNDVIFSYVDLSKYAYISYDYIGYTYNSTYVYDNINESYSYSYAYVYTYAYNIHELSSHETLPSSLYVDFSDHFYKTNLYESNPIDPKYASSSNIFKKYEILPINININTINNINKALETIINDNVENKGYIRSLLYTSIVIFINDTDHPYKLYDSKFINNQLEINDNIKIGVLKNFKKIITNTTALREFLSKFKFIDIIDGESQKEYEERIINEIDTKKTEVFENLNDYYHYVPSYNSLTFSSNGFMEKNKIEHHLIYADTWNLYEHIKDWKKKYASKFADYLANKYSPGKKRASQKSNKFVTYHRPLINGSHFSLNAPIFNLNENDIADIYISMFIHNAKPGFINYDHWKKYRKRMYGKYIDEGNVHNYITNEKRKKSHYYDVQYYLNIDVMPKKLSTIKYENNDEINLSSYLPLKPTTLDIRDYNTLNMVASSIIHDEEFKTRIEDNNLFHEYPLYPLSTLDVETLKEMFEWCDSMNYDMISLILYTTNPKVIDNVKNIYTVNISHTNIDDNDNAYYNYYDNKFLNEKTWLLGNTSQENVKKMYIVNPRTAPCFPITTELLYSYKSCKETYDILSSKFVKSYHGYAEYNIYDMKSTNSIGLSSVDNINELYQDDPSIINKIYIRKPAEQVESDGKLHIFEKNGLRYGYYYMTLNIFPNNYSFNINNYYNFDINNLSLNEMLPYFNFNMLKSLFSICKDAIVDRNKILIKNDRIFSWETGKIVNKTSGINNKYLYRYFNDITPILYKTDKVQYYSLLYKYSQKIFNRPYVVYPYTMYPEGPVEKDYWRFFGYDYTPIYHYIDYVDKTGGQHEHNKTKQFVINEKQTIKRNYLIPFVDEIPYFNRDDKLDSIKQYEFKHFNNSCLYMLEKEIRIKQDGFLTYKELVEHEKTEHVFNNIFVPYIKQYLKIDNKPINYNEILFLFNRYKLDFETRNLKVNEHNDTKMYKLIYKFTLY